MESKLKEQHPLGDVMARKVDTFCERYGIGRSTFYKEVRAGRLKIRKIGRATVVLREDEDAWRLSLPIANTMEAA